MQRKEVIHIYLGDGKWPELEQEETIVDAYPDWPRQAEELGREGQASQPGQTKYRALGMCCIVFLVIITIVIPIVSTFLSTFLQSAYDATISRRLILTLSQHPTSSQVQLYALPAIGKSEQITVTVTGSIHQHATSATGLITFYNGTFTTQVIPARTTLTGKSGVQVVTEQSAAIPPATPTNPPTYGTVSVIAYSAVAGELGNVPASDIDQGYSASIWAKNLYDFSGGKDERDIPVLTKADISTGTQQLTGHVEATINDQAQRETKPGYILLPLTCQTALSANRQVGDQVSTAVLTLTETCTPLAYFAAVIPQAAQAQLRAPRGYQLMSFTTLVLQSNTTATGGILTVQAIAYLKQVRSTISTYHFAGK